MPKGTNSHFNAGEKRFQVFDADRVEPADVGMRLHTGAGDAHTNESIAPVFLADRVQEDLLTDFVRGTTKLSSTGNRQMHAHPAHSTGVARRLSAWPNWPRRAVGSNWADAAPGSRPARSIDWPLLGFWVGYAILFAASVGYFVA